jgi:hypothetical protein
MWELVSRWLYRVSAGWMVLTAVLVFILFTALVLPGQTRNGPESEGAGSPDLSIYYSAGELYDMAEGFGQSGRDAYVYTRFTFDLVWPLVYTFFLVTTISWIYQRVLPSGSRWRVINLLPLLGMLGDYLENISTSIVMWRYPQLTPVLDWMAGIFTATKWLLITGSFIALLAGIVLVGWQLIRKDRGRA